MDPSSLYNSKTNYIIPLDNIPAYSNNSESNIKSMFSNYQQEKKFPQVDINNNENESRYRGLLKRDQLYGARNKYQISYLFEIGEENRNYKIVDRSLQKFYCPEIYNSNPKLAIARKMPSCQKEPLKSSFDSIQNDSLIFENDVLEFKEMNISMAKSYREVDFDQKSFCSMEKQLIISQFLTMGTRSRSKLRKNQLDWFEEEVFENQKLMIKSTTRAKSFNKKQTRPRRNNISLGRQRNSSRNYSRKKQSGWVNEHVKNQFKSDDDSASTTISSQAENSNSDSIEIEDNHMPKILKRKKQFPRKKIKKLSTTRNYEKLKHFGKNKKKIGRSFSKDGKILTTPEKLKIQLELFVKDLNSFKEMEDQEKDLLKFVLKFLYDMPITNEEFFQLSKENQSDFKQFLIDRFFKTAPLVKKVKKKTISRDLNLNPKIENLSQKSLSQRKKLQMPSMVVNTKGLKRVRTGASSSPENFVDNGINLDSPIQFAEGKKLIEKTNKIISLKPEEAKNGILEFLKENPLQKESYLGKRANPLESSSPYEMEILKISKADILADNFNFTSLQKYLRNRELMSIVCKRKQKEERKAKRNDEKTKKIFKRIMKNLLLKYKTSLGKEIKNFSSLEVEEKFYDYYFSDLQSDIRCFYDPLKKRFKNPKFRSISVDYLAQLSQSGKFVADLKSYCNQEMIFDGLEQYPLKILTRFRENRYFLRGLDKAKSKFEWVKFEFVTAVLHFLFTFQNAVNKQKKQIV